MILVPVVAHCGGSGEYKAPFVGAIAGILPDVIAHCGGSRAGSANTRFAPTLCCDRKAQSFSNADVHSSANRYILQK